MGVCDQIPQLPEDPIFGLSAAFKADLRREKLFFVTGYFWGEDLHTPILKAVRQAEKELAALGLKREYLPIDGDVELVNEIGKLVLGPYFDRDRVCAVQTVGGTGALYLAGSIVSNWADQIAISDPTWVNHWHIFASAQLKTEPYPYCKGEELLFEECLSYLNTLPRRGGVLLHTNCHNPTGLDFSQEQWIELVELIRKKELFPILDMAYQGFSMPPEEDAFAPRLFAERGLEFAITYTCAKNFSLYGERVGALFFVTDSKKGKERVESQLKRTIRALYSNPPIYGAWIVKTILKDPHLKRDWIDELEKMRGRMKRVRKEFAELLSEKEPDVSHASLQFGKGLFYQPQLPLGAVERMRQEKGVYIAADRRINLTGLNKQNMERMADLIVAMRKR